MSNPLTGPILLIGSPGDPAPVRYACGFVAVDPMVVLLHGKKTWLVVPLLELGRARKEARGAQVLTPLDLPIKPQDRRRVSAWVTGLLKQLGITRIQTPPETPAGIVRTLEAARIRVHLLDTPLHPQRAIKSSAEVRKISESQRAAVAATQAAIRVLREASVNRSGVLMWKGSVLTSERVRAVVDHTLLDHGCMARDTIIAGGRQAADPHDRGHGPLRANTTIVLDIFPQHKTHGYWGDITRTVMKGSPSKKQTAMFRVVKRAQEVALKMIRPGVRVRAIHETIQKIFDDAGFSTTVKNGVARGFFHGTGHGVGLEIHEAPSISLNDARLKAGQVVTVEPGLYYPELGGVRIEDTVLVTKRGVKVLAPLAKSFVI